LPYNARMTPQFTPEAIAAHCKNSSAAALKIEIVAQTGSTNDDLIARLDPNTRGARLNAPTLLIALTQTAGRGRGQRVWYSDSQSLTFSLAWRFQLDIAALAGLSLSVGVAIAEALNQAAIPIRLKWPNDLLLGNGKAGGILIETVTNTSLLHQQAWAVIGVGINVGEAVKPITKEQHASSSLTNSAPLPIAWLPITDRAALIAALLDSLVESLAIFAKQRLQPFIERWNSLDAYAEQPVTIFDQQRCIHQGVAKGIDATGRLQLQTTHELIALTAGDVSLRLTEDGHHAVAH
jgi:BirA family biotin operon repressor/biotin-[acetyl-CoA-carboxylase] ligase